MKVISKLPSLVGAPGVRLSPLSDKLPVLLRTRQLMIAQMSGVPRARNTIRSLSRLLNLSSLDALLRSMLYSKLLSRVTADIMLTVDGLKTEKYTINRSEVVALVVAALRELSLTTTITPEDQETMAALIVTLDSNPNAWSLEASGFESGSLLGDIKRLYEDAARNISDEDLPAYNIADGTIVRFVDLPQNMRLREILDKADQSDDQAVLNAREHLHGAATIHRLALIRIIDHIWSLMMEVDCWYNFVPARTTATVASHIERGNGLSVYSMYLTELLLYPSFFAFEMVLENYEILQKWLVHFPTLPVDTAHMIDNTIRPLDRLHAREDVQTLLSSFVHPDHEEENILVAPAEFMSQLELSEAMNVIAGRVQTQNVNLNVSDLTALSGVAVTSFVAGLAVGTVGLTTSISNMILVGGLITTVARNMISSIIPAAAIGYAKSIETTFESIGFKCTIPFQLKSAPTYQVDKQYIPELNGGRLILDTATLPATLAIREYLRGEYSYRLASDFQIAKGKAVAKKSDFSRVYGNPLDPIFAFDRDKAALLAPQYTGPKRSYYPADVANGDPVMSLLSYESITASIHSLEAFIESLFSMSWRALQTRATLEYQRRDWATIVSSFALLYFDSLDDRDLPTIMNQRKLKENNSEVVYPDGALTSDATALDAARGIEGLSLVQGHGSPYGTSYNSLESLQGRLSPKTELIPLGGGLFMRILSHIPIVTDALTLTRDYGYNKPFIHFVSNGDSFRVTMWCQDSPMLHHTCIPLGFSPSVPPAIITRSLVFHNYSLLINVDPYIVPTTAAKPRETYDVSSTVRNWTAERLDYYIQYVVPAKGYAARIAGVETTPNQSDDEIAAMIEKGERMLEEQAAAAAQEIDKLDDAESKTPDAVESEIVEAGRKKKARGNGGSSDDVVSL